MEFVVKYSKTDQRQMIAATVVVGRKVDVDFCPLVALLGTNRKGAEIPFVHGHRKGGDICGAAINVDGVSAGDRHDTKGV